MSMMRVAGHSPIALLVTLAVGACAPQTPEAQEPEGQAVVAEVTTWLDSFWATWEEGAAGYDRGLSMFDDHPAFVFALDGRTWRSVPDVAQAFRSFFQTVDHQVFDQQPPVIAVLGPDMVHVMQAGTFTQFLADGVSTGPTQYVATMVLVLSAGGWKVRFIHQSTPQMSGAGS